MLFVLLADIINTQSNNWFILYFNPIVCNREVITINSKLECNYVYKKFKNDSFTNKQLYEIYLETEPDLKYSTFRWRVYSLKEKKCIYNVGRGLYKAGEKNDFSPVISKNIKMLYKQIDTQFPYIKFCIWETKWLHNYMIHQPVIDNTIIEIEKDAASSVFNFLKDTYDNVFLNPDENIINNYIESHNKNIIVKNLITTSPLTTKENIKIPTAEKILVDLCIENLYKAYQGNELKNIYTAFFEQYAINCSNLYWYASKRYAEKTLTDFLGSNNITGCERMNK